VAAAAGMRPPRPRRGHRERGGGPGVDGSGAGASAAAKTSELGHHDQEPEKELAAGVRPPGLVDWGTEGGGGVWRGSGRCGHGERGGGFGGDEAAATAAGGATDDGGGRSGGR